MTEVSAVKEECAKRERIAESKAQEADRLKSHLKAVEADLSGQIDKKAQNLVQTQIDALNAKYELRERKLDNEYKGITATYYTVLFGSLLYGLLTTVFTAIRSKAFVSDFKTFFSTIGHFLMQLAKSLVWLGDKASQLGDKIPQAVVAFIVHWLLWIVVAVGLGVLCAVVVFGLGYMWFLWFKDEQADLASLAVFLISLAVLIFFAEPIRVVIPINLILLLLIIQAVAQISRYAYKRYRKSKGYYY